MRFKTKSQKSLKELSQNQRIRVGMVVFSTYPSDNRVRRAAEALSEAGMDVDIICLKSKGQPVNEVIGDIDVYRINLSHERRGHIRYLFEYAVFIAATAFILTTRAINRHYDIIYIHNMPDILIYTACINKLSGTKLILDLHDPMPELYQTIFEIPKTHLVIRFLAFLEKISIGFADAAVTTNIAFRDLFIQRSCRPEKMHIVMNTPMEDLFSNCTVTNPVQAYIPQKDTFNLMYHGTIVHRHGLDIAIRAAGLASENIPNLRFHIYGDGGYEEEAKRMVKDLNLNQIVQFHGNVPTEEIVSALGRIDAGIVPNRLSPFTNTNFPTRIFECLIMKKPVIAARTKGILDYFKEDECYFFEPGNVNDLCAKIIHIYQHPQAAQEMVYKGKDVLSRHQWTNEKKVLITLVRRLLKHR